MANDTLVIFISFGWLLSVIPISYMYLRMQHMKKELIDLKNRMYVSQEEMDHLHNSLEKIRKNQFD